MLHLLNKYAVVAVATIAMGSVSVAGEPTITPSNKDGKVVSPTGLPKIKDPNQKGPIKKLPGKKRHKPMCDALDEGQRTKTKEMMKASYQEHKEKFQARRAAAQKYFATVSDASTNEQQGLEDLKSLIEIRNTIRAIRMEFKNSVIYQVARPEQRAQVAKCLFRGHRKGMAKKRPAGDKETNKKTRQGGQGEKTDKADQLDNPPVVNGFVSLVETEGYDYNQLDEQMIEDMLSDD